MTDRIHLNALNMNVELNKGQIFVDLGFVNYIQRDPFSYLDYYLYGDVKQEDILGQCKRSYDLTRIKIYYKKTTPEKTLHTMGHEETHGLFYLGRLSELHKEFELREINPEPIHFDEQSAKKHDEQIKSILENNQELRDRLYLSTFKNEEVLCDLGGVLALKKHNYTNTDIRRIVTEWKKFISPIVLDCL